MVITKNANNMTQRDLVMSYVREYGEILPARMSGKIYRGHMMGSETSKRCRELRQAGKLVSHGDGKFEVFTLSESEQPAPEGYAKINNQLFKIV